MIKRIVASLLCTAISAFGQMHASNQAPVRPQNLPALTYNRLIGAGYDLLRQGRIGEAYLAATRATVKDPSRFEGYALAALALHVHGSDQQAKPFADKALRLGPPAKLHLLRELDAQISARISAASTAVHKPDAPNPEMRRKLDLLHLIIQDADKARTTEERKKYLREFLNKSEPFVTEYPNDPQIWLLRGAAAVELESAVCVGCFGYAAAAGPGREAAFRLIKLGLDKSNEDKVRILMAKMDRRGWIYEMNLQAEPQVADFNNALRAMGTVKGSGSFPGAEGQSYISKDFSYGNLKGTCESGFDIESTVKVRDNLTPIDSDTGPRRTTADEIAVLHIDLTEPRFCSYAVPDKGFNKSLVVIQPRHEIRNKRGHSESIQSGVSSSDDSEPGDDDFMYLAADAWHASHLSELLNKLRWACLLQSDTEQRPSPNLLLPAQAKTTEQ